MLSLEKSVDSSVYTRNYYLTDCTGFEEFKQSFGDILEPRFKELLKYLNIKEGMKVLDIGCGRGELVLFAAKCGAEGVGIDYSKEAIKLANYGKSKQNKSVRNKIKFLVMDAKKLGFKESTFDLILLTDVIEHLYDKEQFLVLKEIKRVLKPNGNLIIHSAPNKFFVDIGYKFYSYPISSAIVALWNTITGRKYPNLLKPNKLRTTSHALMHVNEPTYPSLKRLFRVCEFDGLLISSNITAKKPHIGIKDILFNFFVFLHPISKYFPLNIIFGSDFVAVLKNKK